MKTNCLRTRLRSDQKTGSVQITETPHTKGVNASPAIRCHYPGNMWTHRSCLNGRCDAPVFMSNTSSSLAEQRTLALILASVSPLDLSGSVDSEDRATETTLTHEKTLQVTLCEV